MLGWSTVVQLCIDEDLVLSIFPAGLDGQRIEVLVGASTGELVYHAHVFVSQDVAARVYSGIQQVLKDSRQKIAA